MTVLACIALAAWCWLLLFRGSFWRIDRVPQPLSQVRWPSVIAAIPARDEAAVVARAVASLLAQDYPGRFTVVLADDHSTDGTADVARAAAQAAGKPDILTAIDVPPLPEGWTGKMWAQSNAIKAGLDADPGAELVLLTDADIAHAPDELRRMVSRLIEDKLDMASLMVRLSVKTELERLIIPAFVFFFRLLYPFRWVSDPASTVAAAAGGYVLIRRSRLESIGGLEAIKGALIDDCTLAGRVKDSGGRIALDLAPATESLRVYQRAEEMWMMIARTAFTQLDYSALLLAGTVIAMLIGFVVPPLAFLVHGSPAGFLAWAAMSFAYAPMLKFYNLPVIMAPLLPLVALFYLGATVDSARRHWQGRGGEWKGRISGGEKE